MTGWIRNASLAKVQINFPAFSIPFSGNDVVWPRGAARHRPFPAPNSSVSG